MSDTNTISNADKTAWLLQAAKRAYVDSWEQSPKALDTVGFAEKALTILQSGRAKATDGPVLHKGVLALDAIVLQLNEVRSVPVAADSLTRSFEPGEAPVAVLANYEKYDYATPQAALNAMVLTVELARDTMSSHLPQFNLSDQMQVG